MVKCLGLSQQQLLKLFSLHVQAFYRLLFFVYLFLCTMSISFSVLLLTLFVSCYHFSWEMVLKDLQINVSAFLHFFEAAGCVTSRKKSNKMVN